MLILMKQYVAEKLLWTDVTERQLNAWGAKYNELRVDKPFYDLFIEDKALRIEEV